MKTTQLRSPRTIDFKTVHKNFLESFPIVKTLSPEEFGTWYKTYIRPGELVVAILNDTVICTNRAIAYALPKGYKFVCNLQQNGVSIGIESDPNIKYYNCPLLSKYKPEQILADTANIYTILVERFDLYPLLPQFELFTDLKSYYEDRENVKTGKVVYDNSFIIDMNNRTFPIWGPFGISPDDVKDNEFEYSMYKNQLSFEELVEEQMYIYNLTKNYMYLWMAGYDITPNSLNLNNAVFRHNCANTFHNYNMLFKSYKDMVWLHKDSLNRDINELLASDLVIDRIYMDYDINTPAAETTVSKNNEFVLSPAGFPNINHCNCGHDHSQCNTADNNITVSSIVNNLSAIENAANTPENRLNNLIINSIRQAGFDCTIEPRQSGLFNINVINNGTLDINRSFVADLNGLVVDPRPKYFPFIKPNTFPIDQDLFINYADIGNVFNNENGEYIADQDIKDLMLNNTVNARSRCYSDEDAKLLTMVNTLSITNKNIDNNTKMAILKSILKALKNPNLINEINKYQDMPMFVLTGMKSNTNFTIRSDMSAGKLSTKAIIIDFDLTKSTDSISFYTE